MTDTEPMVFKGLAGVVADTTAVSMVNAETNSLTYRGYPVQELAASCSFEEVAYLLWHGELPDRRHSSRALSKPNATCARSTRQILAILGTLPVDCHPMDVLRTAVSIIGAHDPTAADHSVEANLARSLSLMAKLPAIVAFDQRRRRGEAPYRPDPDSASRPTSYTCASDPYPSRRSCQPSRSH